MNRMVAKSDLLVRKRFVRAIFILEAAEITTRFQKTSTYCSFEALLEMHFQG